MCHLMLVRMCEPAQLNFHGAVVSYEVGIRIFVNIPQIKSILTGPKATKNFIVWAYSE